MFLRDLCLHNGASVAAVSKVANCEARELDPDTDRMRVVLLSAPYERYLRVIFLAISLNTRDILNDQPKP